MVRESIHHKEWSEQPSQTHEGKGVENFWKKRGDFGLDKTAIRGTQTFFKHPLENKGRNPSKTKKRKEEKEMSSEGGAPYGESKKKRFWGKVEGRTREGTSRKSMERKGRLRLRQIGGWYFRGPGKKIWSIRQTRMRKINLRRKSGKVTRSADLKRLRSSNFRK